MPDPRDQTSTGGTAQSEFSVYIEKIREKERKSIDELKKLSSTSTDWYSE